MSMMKLLLSLAISVMPKCEDADLLKIVAPDA